MSNPQHRLFVQHYLALGSAPEAASLAGYSPQYGSKLLKRPHIQEMIDETVEGDPEVAGRSERLRYLTAVMRGVDPYLEIEEGEVDRWGGFGHPADLAIEPKDRLKACEMLCKISGDFQDEQVDQSTHNVFLMFSREEREEGRRLAGGGRKNVEAIEADWEEAS